ncbi:hypothetical protein [Nitrospira sp. BLG_1]|uniref:hypothetical protein n=1 Tax=Nitrospira sp. BLG_1 TaxID=3395883 RepID=UPI0039BD8C3A
MMNQFGQARQLLVAVFLMGVVSAGCATASLADGDKPQAQPADPLPFETQLDTQTILQAQNDGTTPKQPLAEEVVPVQPQNDLPPVLQPQEPELPPAQATDTTPTIQPPVDSPPPTAQQEIVEPAPVRVDVNPSIELTGRVWRAKPGIVFLKTPIGLMSLSSKTTLKSLPASQEVSFMVHDDYIVIDIVRRTDGTFVHRYLTGPFKRDSVDNTKLLLWTPTSGMKAFHMGTYESALTAPKNGEFVTVEVDGAGNIIGVHDLQFDLQIGQIAPPGSKAHLLLTGTISKMKSNFIFFKTPIGIVNVNTKIGIKSAKIGQTMTLHMHNDSVVADLAASNDSALLRRFVTGPLDFAAPDHAAVRLWTPEGEQTFPIEGSKSLLNGAREGTPITVELNGLGEVVELHRVK